MRQFLRLDEAWKDWEELDMEWIHHHNPDLVIFDDNGRERERIDLNGFSRQRLEDLLEKKGFRRR